jgi:hypothetical protein
MTRSDLVDKWLLRFANNDTFEIDEADLREFTQDVAATFAESGYQQFKELVLPQAVLAGQWYLDGGGIWEPRKDFYASVSPVNGPNWRQVVSFTGQSTQVITSASITDATPAGRKMLQASSAEAQRALLSNPAIKAGQYGTHPGWDNTDKPGGLYEWLIQAILALQANQPQPVRAPQAPTAGLVDDTADTFSFVPNPAYPSFAQYKVNGLPGVVGAVVLDSTNSYVQGSRIYVKVVGAVAKGGLAVYVAGSGSVPDGQVLTNADPFTGAVVTPPSPSLTAALALSLANVTLGSSVAFTITPAGGNAPYAYQVVATDNATGQQFTLGSAQTGSWTPTAIGSYAIDATVTDSSNPVKTAQAATRYLQVVAAANRIPVADAGSDATIQLPTSSMALMGTASDPDQGDTLTYAWRQVTGPNSATGLPATTLNVVVSNLVAGTYQFGFRSTDNHGAPSAEDYVLVTVQAAAGGGMPLLIVGAGDSITAGPDKGTGSDPGNAPIAFANARVSAPASNYTRMGYPGQTLRWFLDNHKADAASSFLASRRGVFYFAFGANDINARTRAQREADFIEAADWALSLPNVEAVLFIPVLNRTDQFGYALMADGTHGDFNAERLYFNNWLATTLAARSSRILVGNFSQDSALGAAGYPSNALLCSSDQVHPSVDGSRHLGERVIAELIAQLPGITLGPYTADGSSSGGGGSTTYLPSPQPITHVAKTAYEADANGRLTKNAGGMQWNSGGRAPLKIDLPSFVTGETGLLEYEQPRAGRSGVLFGATNQAFAPSDISTGDYCFYEDATSYGIWEVGSFAPATFDDGSQSGAGTLPAEAGVRQLRFTRVNANSATGDRVEWLVGGKVRRTINGKFTKQLFLVAYLNGDGSNGEAASEAPLGTVTCSKILAA